MAINKGSSLAPSLGQATGRYRINYLYPDGTILRTKPISAADDKEAIEYARRLMDGRALDLWDGLRFIKFFPAIDEAQEEMGHP